MVNKSLVSCLVLGFLLLVVLCVVQVQSLELAAQWVNRLTGIPPNEEHGQDVSSDRLGNSYFVGFLNAPATSSELTTINPANGQRTSLTFNETDNVPNPIAVKYNAQGVFQWRTEFRTIALPNNNAFEPALPGLQFSIAGMSIAAAPSGNAVYVTWLFSSNATNPASIGTVMARLNTNNGSVVWIRFTRFTDTSRTTVLFTQDSGVSCDENNLYVTGWLLGNVGFAGTINITSGAATRRRVFLARVNAANGDVTQVTVSRDVANWDVLGFGLSVMCSPSLGNRVRISGNFDTGQVFNGNFPLPNPIVLFPGTRLFVHRGGFLADFIASSFQPVWTAGATNRNGFLTFRGVGTYPGRGIAPVAGYHHSPSGRLWFTDADGSVTTFAVPIPAGANLNDIVAAAADINGNWIWTRSWGNANSDERALALSPDTALAEAYITGYLTQLPVNFGNGVIVQSLGNSPNIFLVRVGPGGNSIDGSVFGSATGIDIGVSVSVPPTGTPRPQGASQIAYLTGTFSRTANFRNGQTITGPAPSSIDGFFARILEFTTSAPNRSAVSIEEEVAE